MIKELLFHKSLHIPWSINIDNDFEIDGELGVNNVCKTKCIERKCKSLQSSLLGIKCPLGLTVYEARVSEYSIKVFGVVGPQFKEFLPKHPEFRNACKGRSVTAHEFSLWIESLKKTSKFLDAEFNKKLRDSLSPLHDVMKLARNVGDLANASIQEIYPKEKDKFNSATKTQKALLKASYLLVDSFDFLEIYLNPIAAGFGSPKSVEIYKMLDKICRIASLSGRNESKAYVRLNGVSRKSLDVFESLKLVFLTLVDNAQKYSRKSADVKVEISDAINGIYVSVESEGNLIKEGEIDRVFERGFRGASARELNTSGMGLGLYIAETVAKAHNFKIQVKSIPLGYEVENRPQARNVFFFTISNVSKRKR